MEPKTLFHGSNLGGLDLFRRLTSRTIAFTTDPTIAYRDANKRAKQFDSLPVVVVLKKPSVYSPTVRGCSKVWYNINLKSNPVNLESDRVDLVENPTLEQLCKYLK